MKQKPDYERAIKKSVSMPHILFDKAEMKARQLGFSTFSDYLQSLLRKDVLKEAV